MSKIHQEGNEQLGQDEVAILIRSRKILKAKGLPKDADVKTICEAACVSRKTGYQWASKLEQMPEEQEGDIKQEFDLLKGRHEELERRYDDLRFENEGRKLAWEIHGVDKLLDEKKSNTGSRKKRRR